MTTRGYKRVQRGGTFPRVTGPCGPLRMSCRDAHTWRVVTPSRLMTGETMARVREQQGLPDVTSQVGARTNWKAHTLERATFKGG